MNISPVLLRSSIVAALAGLLFGFDTAVISGTTGALTKVFGLTEATLGFTVASALIGTIIGAIIAGKPADRYGRRAVLVAIAILYFVSALGSAAPWNWYSFLFFRFIGGIGVGAASVVAPMYVAEISPARVRGRLVALVQFNIVLGILLAFLSNYIVGISFAEDVAWRWMFGVEAVPAAVFFLLLFTAPESPRWLVLQQREPEAKTVLAKLGTDGGAVDEEIRVVRESAHMEAGAADEPLFHRKYRVPIMLAIAIAAFNQLSGINALMYYAPDIFKMAGAGATSALLQSVAIGGTNLLFTMLALLIIDRFGRRNLMLVGSIGYLLSLSVTAWAFYKYGGNFDKTGGTIVLVSLLVFIASHAFGQGAVIWVFISEIFPNRVRARGQALGSFTHWFMAAAISWTFPIIAAASGGHAFAFYAVMMFLQLCWVIWIMPETKGVPLEEIQKKLGIA